MVQDCPKCKLVNPPTAVLCDCGYNFQTRTRDPRLVPRRKSASGFADGVVLGKQAVGGLFVGVIATVLLVVEIAGGEPVFWRIAGCLLVIAFAVCWFGRALWRSNR